jgi:ABC-2 type transport system ATP-binding protein
MAAIQTENLSKYYKDVRALDGLDLEVPDNVIFGFLGPNGAGKTTAVKLLTGFAHPTRGSARVADEAVKPDNSALKELIGLLPDVPAFYNWMSAREYLRFTGRLYTIPADELANRVEELLDLVGLSKQAHRRIGGFSRGMRQRLGIAQALINRPRVLFLDEPTSALDPVGKREVLDLIIQLKTKSTVFMSSHNLSEVERVCDMVGIINRGRLLTVSSVESLQKKFARSVFEIEFLEEAGSFLKTLQGISWLQEPEMVIKNGLPVVRVQASDTQYAREELPGLVAASGLTLSRYELVLPNLEDIFMQILSQETEN